jgi:hypothetical protein
MPIYLGNTEIGKEFIDSYELGNVYLGATKIQSGGEGTYISATGGTISYSGNYKIHTFVNTSSVSEFVTNSSQSFTIESLGSENEFNTIEYLIVGGGSAGSSQTYCGFGCPYTGGSGGAGGTVRTGSFTINTTGSMTMTIGGGGYGFTSDITPPISTIQSGQGGNSQISSSIYSFNVSASGGGSVINTGFQAYGGSNADYSGGTAQTTQRTGGGGAGAGENGENGSNDASIAANGGDGIASNITGVSIYYGGGGGARAAAPPGANGSGGLGGGGNVGQTGSMNLGGGGGAGEPAGMNGGNGVVIVRYPFR